MSIKDGVLVKLDEYQKQLENCVKCYCGLCIKNCPMSDNLKINAFSPRGISLAALGIVQGKYDISKLSDEIIYACTGCRACENYCGENKWIPVKDRKSLISGATIAEIFRSMKVESGSIHPKVRDALNNIAKYGNPYAGLPKVKDDWVSNLAIKNDSKDTILYVGSMVPYDDSAKIMAEAVIDIFKNSKMEFAILGSEEMDSGANAIMMGEEGLFEKMIEHNLDVFKKYGVKQIICISPHDYDTFVHYYDNLGGVKIKHYSQIIWEMIDTGRIKLNKKLSKKITYHDPCYLGRRNSIFNEPRNILRSIPGVELIEMELARENAYCCGGGGTGLWMDIKGVHMDLKRADQINEVNAQIVAVACPICSVMLKSAMDSRGYDIEVTDIAQLVKESCC
jgi:Fe-S oxidoreductase